MACVNADGTITTTAKELLQFVSKPFSPEEIAEQLKRPLFKVRVSLRELSEAGFIKESDGKYVITDAGKDKLKA